VIELSGIEIAKKIGLDIKECKSISQPVNCKVDEVEKIVAEKFQQSGANFVAWQVQNIVFGRLEGGKIILKDGTADFENVLEFRIFNEVEELQLKKIAGNFSGRYICDEVGEGNFFADSFARFWGECKNFENNFVKLIDSERKICLEIPSDFQAKYYGLLTRNYIGSDTETGLSGYVDYRFVKIEGADIG